MKALLINGSPKSNGSTALLLNKMIHGMNVSKIETTLINIGQKQINFCKGCEACRNTQKCIQNDDMVDIINQILETDILVLASPSYWGDVTGQMKTFIDRCLFICNAKTGTTIVPKGKIGISIAIRAGDSKKENEQILNTFNHYLGHLEIKTVAKMTVEGIATIEDIKQQSEKLQEAYNIGKQIKEKL